MPLPRQLGAVPAVCRCVAPSSPALAALPSQLPTLTACSPGGRPPLDQPRCQSPAAAELTLWPLWEELWHRPLCQGGAGPGSPSGLRPAGTWARQPRVSTSAESCHCAVPPPGRAWGVPCAKGGSAGAAAAGWVWCSEGGSICAWPWLSAPLCARALGGSLSCPPPWHPLPLTDELRAVAGPGGRE